MNSEFPLPSGLAPIEKLWPIGIMPNAAHQPSSAVFSGTNFTLAIVEFDDQGRCQDRGQMDALENKLAEFQGRDTITLVFVHGWRHDGRSDDDNLGHFCRVLQTVAAEASAENIPVIGVFVAWRGLSLYGYGILELATFWRRKEAGMRVAMGAPRELFGRLRFYRRMRQDAGGAPLLLIIGHSFGGMIVYTALAQSLSEAATTASGHIVPSFADLVLLVNPAFEAERYLPIHDLVKLRGEGSFAQNQWPIFVSVTAKNDSATGIAFPAGTANSLLQERVKGCEEALALFNTMGHLAWMQTHELSTAQSSKLVGPAWQSFSNTLLKKIRFDDHNPFWVVTATKDVVDGHNGIWKPTFRDFVEGLLVGHTRQAQVMRTKHSKIGA
jgi:pimeloyl-ACP methyl ester carboxylesterase